MTLSSRSRGMPAALAALAMAFAGCAHSPSSGPSGDPAALGQGVGQIVGRTLRPGWSETSRIEVLYATNRALNGAASCGNDSFGVVPGAELHFGACQVNVPKNHPVGLIEPDSDPRADTHRYFRILGHEALAPERLSALLREPGAGAWNAGVLVFVHGFNVRFEEAVLRAAQIAYDLKFPGKVLLFSWPAGASSGFFDGTLIHRTYASNRASAASSVDQAVGLLKLLAAQGVPLHLMVHSMGHQVVLPALARVGAELSAPFIRELILNAPDFGVEDFARVAPAVTRLAHRVTLYCSYKDNAIAASETYNGGRRLGGCEQAEGVDVVNVGEVDSPALGIAGLGHGYYASRPVLTDVYQVLLGIEAEKRLFIRKGEPNSPENFFLRP